MYSAGRTKTAKIGYLVMSGLLCLLGLILMIYPEMSITVFYYALGAILLAYGIVKIIGYFSKDLYRLAFQFDLAFGVLLVTVGLILLFHPAKVISLIHIILGIVIFSDSLFKIQIVIDSKRFGVSTWWLIAAFAVLTGIFGLLVMLNPFESASVIMILLGAALFLEGILSLSVALCAVKISKQRPDTIETTITFKEDDE